MAPCCGCTRCLLSTQENMCAEWREGLCLWRAPSWSPLSLQALCLVSSHAGKEREADKLDTTQGSSHRSHGRPQRQHCLPCLHESSGPPVPSHTPLVCWRLTLCPLLLALGVTPPVRIESSSSHVAEGQSLDLNCLVAGQAHPQISWHKRGGSLPARHQVGGGKLRKGPEIPGSWEVKSTGCEFKHLQFPYACHSPAGQPWAYCLTSLILQVTRQMDFLSASAD